jgi:hypothetical protein
MFLALSNEITPPPSIKSSSRPANTSLVRGIAPVPFKFVARTGGIDEYVKVVIVKPVPLHEIISRHRRNSDTFTGQRRSQARVINHNDARGQILRILSLPPLDEVVLNPGPNSTVDADGRSAKPSTSIAEGIGETVPTKPHVSDSRIQESAEASVADSVVFDLRAVGLDAEPDEVVRDLVPDHLHSREVVHAQADEPILRPRGTDLVTRHFGVDGAGGQEPVLGRVEQFVIGDLGVLGAKDEDVEPGKFFDGEPGDFDASDRPLDAFDAYVLADEAVKVEFCSGDADACLGGRFIVIRTGEVGAFVVYWYGRW